MKRNILIYILLTALCAACVTLAAMGLPTRKEESAVAIHTAPLQWDREASPAWSPYAKGPVRMAGNSSRFTPRRTASGIRKAAAPISGKSLVILAEYDDERFFYGANSFKKMLTEKGYSINGADGCAAEYFKDQTGIDFEFTLVGPVRVSHERKYYGLDVDGQTDEHHGEFIAEACTLAADSCAVDFSQFDCDGDGVVDNVFVFFAGEDQAQQNGQNSEYMWSHSSFLEYSDYGKVLEISGVKVNRYSCASELFLTADGTARMAPIGTFCHEYSHSLGLADMYDTDYELSGGTAAGLWRVTGLMDGGNYNNEGNTPPSWNAVERDMSGVMEIADLKPGSYTINPLGTEGAAAYRIPNKADSLEYYILECRSNLSKWDRFIGGKGLLVYHIDRSDKRTLHSEVYNTDFTPKQRWETYNEVNCLPDHQCADLVEADQRTDKNPTAAQWSDVSGIFFPQGTASALGGDAAVKLNFHDGSSSSLMISSITLSEDGSVNFKVSDLDSPIPPEPTDTLKLEDPLYIIAIYSEKPSGGAVKAGTNISLRVSNSVGADSVRWFFGTDAVDDPAAFKPASTGTLRAEITWEDGTTDYLFKTITVQ